MFLANECNLNRVKEYLALSFTIAHILKKHIEKISVIINYICWIASPYLPKGDLEKFELFI